MVATVVSPRIMRIGGGAVAGTAELLATLGLKRPLLVTDPFMVSSGLVRRALDPLEAAGIAPAMFSDTVPDPTDTVVEAGAASLRQAGEIDCLIGFGGGSPIDTAKAIAILAAGGGKMRDWKVPRAADLASLPIIAIPTTAGTGSEVTRFTVITDTGRDEIRLHEPVEREPARGEGRNATPAVQLLRLGRAERRERLPPTVELREQAPPDGLGNAHDRHRRRLLEADPTARQHVAEENDSPRAGLRCLGRRIPGIGPRRHERRLTGDEAEALLVEELREPRRRVLLDAPVAQTGRNDSQGEPPLGGHRARERRLAVEEDAEPGPEHEVDRG